MITYNLTHIADDVYEAFANVYQSAGIGGCIGHIYPTEMQAEYARARDGQTVPVMVCILTNKPEHPE